MADGGPSPGAVPVDGEHTRFRVWAPSRDRVDAEVESRTGLKYFPLQKQPAGYFEAVLPVPTGARYRYRLDGDRSFPDPCSRFQPEGPHGPSEVIDPRRFAWSDGGHPGIALRGQVLYEVHVGAYTKEGTFAALARELPELKRLGITTLELMPLNAFPGRFNWGYDGVCLYAPNATYGRPDDLRALVNEAHRIGLGVILDVVYNHLGPDGNYLREFSPRYFTDNPRYPREWGDPPNFDGTDAGPVRHFIVQNAVHWVTEYHLDGLRLDATQSLYDASPRHIGVELSEAVRRAAGKRRLLLVVENEPQDVRWATPVAAGGCGVDAMWVDDFHHSARVAATGSCEAYCQDYRGTPQELLAAALRNSLYQGQWYAWQKQPRGTSLRQLDAPQAVFFLQNHDQVANLLHGHRLHQLSSETLARALTAYWLLLPQTPLLFMGQEFFSSSPFLYFVDHSQELMGAVKKGREEFLSQFPSALSAIRDEGTTPPFGEDAFARSRLDLSERETHAQAYLFHRTLLQLRREDPVFAAQDRGRIEGAVLTPTSLCLRYGGDEGDRLVVLNLGAGGPLIPMSEPLLAPLPGRAWRMLLSSEETRFGGRGAVAPEEKETWTLPAQSTLVLTSQAAP